MQFDVLGAVEVRDATGRAVAIGGPQQRAVLALLLANSGRVVSTDRIVGQLWPDDPPTAARRLVQGCVAALRRVLRTGTDGLLRTSPPGYLLRPAPDALDAHRFEAALGATDVPAEPSTVDLNGAHARLDAALALWRGPAFDGVDLAECRAEAVRLDERRLTALERRVDVGLRLGRHAGMVADLDALTGAHPMRERLWAHLMVALLRAGRQAEALAAYRRVREILVREVGVEPGAELRRVHEAVLAGQDPFPPPVGGTSVVVPVPVQLPAVATSFVGRGRQLDRLDALRHDLTAAPQQAPAVAVICGSAGVGKTTLAVCWGRQVRDAWPDGQLYVDLRGHASGVPVRPIDALTGFLLALGVPSEQIPPDEPTAAAQYRTRLAGRKVLVVLDNAASVEQVRPLLPGGVPSLALVTSRHRLGGLTVREGAVPIVVDVLDPAEARDLLTRVIGPERVGAEPAAADRLAALCAYLPLAVRIVAANLLASPGRGLDAHAADLAATHTRLHRLAVEGDDEGTVLSAFHLSYVDLRADDRRLFRTMSLAPGADVTVADAVALLGADPADVAASLRRLVAAHLVDERTPGRYTFHDLLRLFAAERSAADDPRPWRDSAVGRLYRHLLGRARAAADVLYPHMLRLPADPGSPAPPFTAHADALGWLEAERANLVAAVVTGAARGPHRAAWLLADALRGYLHLSRYTTDWLTTANAALRAADLAGDVAGQAAARHSLGTAYRSVTDHRAALAQYHVGLRLARRAGWREAEATALGNLGIVNRKLGRLDEAAQRLTAALAIDRELGRTAGEANNTGLLAAVHLDLGRLDEAARSFAEALRLSRAVGSAHGEALALTGLGQTYREMNRPDEAYRYLRDAMDRYSRVGDRDGVPIVHCELSILDGQTGDVRSARRHAEAGLAVAVETGDRQTESIALTALAATDRLLDRCADAVPRLERALRLARDTGSRRLEANALLGLAATHRQAGRPEDAGRLAGQALTVARTHGFAGVAGVAREALAGPDGPAADVR